MTEEVGGIGYSPKEKWIRHFENMRSNVGKCYRQLEDDLKDVSEKDPELHNIEIILFEEEAWQGASKIILGKDGQDPFFKVKKGQGEEYETFNSAEALYGYLERFSYRFRGDHFISHCTERFVDGVEMVIDNILYIKKAKVKDSLSKI